VHILAGLLLGAVTAVTSPVDLWGGSLVGLVFSQTSLMGIWGGMGTNRWGIRLLGVLVGVSYLGPQFGICIDELNTDTILLVAFATFTVAAALLVARGFGLPSPFQSFVPADIDCGVGRHNSLEVI
jgi:hypothetical protein